MLFKNIIKQITSKVVILTKDLLKYRMNLVRKNFLILIYLKKKKIF